MELKFNFETDFIKVLVLNSIVSVLSQVRKIRGVRKKPGKFNKSIGKNVIGKFTISRELSELREEVPQYC